MRLSRTEIMIFATAFALLVGGTAVQGLWSARWKPISKDAVVAAATLLETRFPKRFGDWQLDKELESDPEELDRAGAVGHISRLYRSGRSKSRVSAFAVCALPFDASAHTPDRCYPGAGFAIGEAEHGVKIDLGEGRSVEALTGTFVKSDETLRIYWTYGVPGKGPGEPLRWVAPQFARWSLQWEPAVYKLYAIANETRTGPTQSMAECENFITELVPALDAALASDDNPPDPDAAGPAAAPEPPSEAAPAATDAAFIRRFPPVAVSLP